MTGTNQKHQPEKFFLSCVCLLVSYALGKISGQSLIMKLNISHFTTVAAKKGEEIRVHVYKM